MFVFAEKGVDAPVVDDVISAAGVSRGTFYKYFESNRDLLIAVNEELGNEIAISVEKLVSPIPDPAERIASGLLMFLATSARFPLFARFTYRVGLEAAGPTTLIYDYLPPHLEEGIKAGAFSTNRWRFCSITSSATRSPVYRVWSARMSDSLTWSGSSKPSCVVWVSGGTARVHWQIRSSLQSNLDLKRCSCALTANSRKFLIERRFLDASVILNRKYVIRFEAMALLPTFALE